MKGTIRTKEKCPVCLKPFIHMNRIGLGCPEHETTPGRFFVDINHKGDRVKIYSNKRGLILSSYDLALETLNHVQYEIRNHQFDPTKYIKRDLQRFLFGNLMQTWLSSKSSLAIAYKYDQFNKDYYCFFKGFDVRDIRTLHIYEFYNQLPERLSPKTKKNILSALNTFFLWLTKLEYIEKRPGIPVITLDQPNWKWVDVDIQAQILTAIPEKDRLIYVFLALHGCRPSEARALKVKDLDFKHAAVKIIRTFSGKSGNILVEHTKTRKQREIPINPEMIDSLRKLCCDKHPEAFVFTNPRTGKSYAKSSYQEIWQQACKDTGISIKSYEGLRHSFASQRVSRGVDIYLISKVLGHTDIRTTQMYAHTNLESLKQVMSINPVPILSLKKKNETNN